MIIIEALSDGVARGKKKNISGLKIESFFLRAAVLKLILFFFRRVRVQKYKVGQRSGQHTIFKKLA